MHAGGSVLRLYDGSYLQMRGLGLDVVSVVEPMGVKLSDFFYSSNQINLLLSPYFCFISFLSPAEV